MLPLRSTWHWRRTSCRTTPRRWPALSRTRQSTRPPSLGCPLGWTQGRRRIMTQTKERFEVRLMKIDDQRETCVEAREVPLERLQQQQQQIAELPNREAMSLVSANLAVPINLAAALNVLSDSSTAGALAEQTTPI